MSMCRILHNAFRFRYTSTVCFRYIQIAKLLAVVSLWVIQRASEVGRVTATCSRERTVEQFECAEDLALGGDSLDVGVVLQREQTAVCILSDLHHLKVAGVVAGWVLTSHDFPVHCLGILHGAADEVTACLRREVPIKCYYILWKESCCFFFLSMISTAIFNYGEAHAFVVNHESINHSFCSHETLLDTILFNYTKLLKM